MGLSDLKLKRQKDSDDLSLDLLQRTADERDRARRQRHSVFSAKQR